jgi:hypothetical protein
MKFFIISLFFLTSYFSIYGQTIKKLEHDLAWRHVSEKDGDKIDKARLLLKKDPFNYAAVKYTLRYYEARKIDSISVFFNDLIKIFPNKVDPYLLRADLLHFEVDYLNDSLFTTKKLEYLNKALRIENNNPNIIYKLASLFYSDFIDPYGYSNITKIEVRAFDKNDSTYTKMDTLWNKHKSVFIHPEDSALFYFHKLENLSAQYKDFLFFPIKQIETFKNISTDKKLDSLMGISNNCYFPSWYFVNLPEKWEYKLTTDYLSQIESSFNYVEYIKSRLEIMKEPCLYQMNITDNAEIYRFTWLRTFRNPISIRVEKRGNNIRLYYKRTNGNGMSGVEKLTASKKRSLSISEWNSFIDLLNKAEFDNLPKRINAPMCDGASWILEKKTKDKFKVFETNIPNSFFKEACLYLINLSRVKVDEKEIY